MNELKFEELQEVNGGASWNTTPYKCFGAVVLGTAAGALTTGGNPLGIAGGYLAGTGYCAK
ncbi:Blp family class II bacteriocin [Romboutsia sedimentorum]|uniref:Blp family class II bacteriocin n=1 Tax=Romboutsia sedimentorum TaxID=1368474 RepID=A0ABT7E9M9_9FIRM|nr:Blp family class II bacteriocin [Romboutsia sedimentorum]MDK2563641.1 Blp family class II bacteriocin [Romboutsia sedimentorum]MDK2586004.1 Blp family class II bacteriocin [Romboutsia sedimentorum]